MVGITVRHKQYGEGTIVSCKKGKTEYVITVHFPNKTQDSYFGFPSSVLSGILTSENGVFLKEAHEKNAEITSGAWEIPVSEHKLSVKASKKEFTSKMESGALRGSGSVVFKCNYCNGHKKENRIGFDGVCSDGVIQYNIEKEKRKWCSDKASRCRKYYDAIKSKPNQRELLRGALDGILTGGGEMDYVCYECQMLRDWCARAGVDLETNTPRRILAAKPNGIAVLTTVMPNSKERDRIIFAVFLIKEVFEGDGKEEGCVTSYPEWRLELTPKEVHEVPFWKYYQNEGAKTPQGKIHWGSNLYRGISDIQAAQILRDIAGIKTEPKDKAFAQSFFEHFCTIHGLDPNDVPAPDGPLAKRQKQTLWGEA